MVLKTYLINHFPNILNFTEIQNNKKLTNNIINTKLVHAYK